MTLSRRKFIKTAFFASAGLAIADAFWIEKFFIESNEFYMGRATKKTTNLKVVQLSDLHLHSINYQLIQLTKKLNKLKPDLILITGDSLDNAKNIPLNDFLKLIDHSIKKVAILGNREHDAKVNLIELEQVYNDNNADLLINQSQKYTFPNKTISITGVDDYVRNKADFSKAIKEYKPSDHHIILNHCPEYSDDISKIMNKDLPVDFILSGHTHGGQINVLGYCPFLPAGSGQYLNGWYKNRTPQLYVSIGIGTSNLPIRFGARAEMAIFHL